jgi:hypothetical protein
MGAGVKHLTLNFYRRLKIACIKKNHYHMLLLKKMEECRMSRIGKFFRNTGVAIGNFCKDPVLSKKEATRVMVGGIGNIVFGSLCTAGGTALCFFPPVAPLGYLMVVGGVAAVAGGSTAVHVARTTKVVGEKILNDKQTVNNVQQKDIKDGAEFHQVVNDQKKDVSEVDKEVTKNEENIKKTEENVQETRTENQAATVQIDQSKQEVKAAEASVEEIEKKAQDIKTAIAEKDAKIAEQHALIKEKDAKIAEKDAEIAEKDAKIAEKDAEIAEKDAKIAEQVTAIEEKDAKIVEQNALIEKQVPQLDAFGTKTITYRAELQRFKKEKEELQQQLNELTKK